MTASTPALWLLLLAAASVSGWRFYWLLRPMQSAAPAARFDQPGLRLMGLLRAMGLHERLLKFRYSGILHAMIFASFFVLATAIVQSFGSVLFPGFSLQPVGGDSWIALLQDIFAVVMTAGVALAVWQRYAIRPARFQGSNATDATIIYGLIMLIVVSMLLEAAFGIAAGTSTSAAWTGQPPDRRCDLGRSVLEGQSGSRHPDDLLAACQRHSRVSDLYSGVQASAHVAGCAKCVLSQH